jgi:hypothetical protein
MGGFETARADVSMGTRNPAINKVGRARLIHLTLRYTERIQVPYSFNVEINIARVPRDRILLLGVGRG